MLTLTVKGPIALKHGVAYFGYPHSNQGLRPPLIFNSARIIARIHTPATYFLKVPARRGKRI